MDPEMASRLAALERRVKILEAVLQRVAIAVAAALEELRAHCENSRRTFSEQFEAALGALTACGQSADLVERYGRLLRGYVDETVLCLETMETQKAAALEGEQVGVDGVLERTSDVLGEVSGAATMAESDFALEVALSALVASLEGASAAQPRGPVEPNLVCITPPRAPPADAIAAAIASPDDCERLLRDCIGRLVAVRAASTDDLRLSGRPKYAVADRPLRLALVLCDAYGHLPSDDLAATLRHAAGLVHGSLSMEPEGDLIDAPVSAALNPDGTCIWVTFALPAGLRAGSSLTLDVTVAGVRPSSSDGMPTILPTSVRVVNGLPPDFRLRNVVNPEDYCMPAVSLAARMYRPCDGPDGPVCSYDSQGVLSLLPRRHELLGFNTLAIISMAEGTGTNPFIVALLRKTDMQRVTFVLVAVPEAAFAEGSTLGPLWTASLAPSTNLGLAVLPRCGIVVSSHCSVDGSILVHDLKTGALLSQAPARYATHIAADDESRMVFASVKLVDGMFGVGIFRWDGVSLTEQVGCHTNRRHVCAPP